MTRERDRTITIQVIGKGADADPRLDDFIEQMEVLKIALRETERLVSGRDPSLYYRIKRLQKNSPAQVTLEAESDVMEGQSTPTYASYVVRNFTTNLRVIANKKRLPVRIDQPALEAYRGLSATTEKHQLEVEIRTGNHSVIINRKFREIIDGLIGEDEFSYGSISGKIEAINLHDRNRRFQIFPVIGASRIVGTFRQKDRKRFAEAVDKYVTVFGRLRYKAWDKHPYEVIADDITIHDFEPDDDRLYDLKGIAPGATNELTTQEYIDQLQDEW
jgi:hypothetical protein